MQSIEILLSVQVTYEGSKVASVNLPNFDTAVKILRTDLTTLKIPHPKVENIHRIHSGCLQFTWRTKRDSVRLIFGIIYVHHQSLKLLFKPLHQCVTTRVYPSSEQVVSHANTLKNLSMCVSTYHY